MSVASYLRFALASADTTRLVAFGFVMTFASSFGQSYFVGVFGPTLREEFDLSHTGWGSIYMAGTLISAAVLPWTGQLVDRMNLRLLTMVVCAGLVLACFSFALAPTVLFLIGSVFLVRQLGQGLAVHVSSTAMVRTFHADRGKAVALTSLGIAVGESILPFLAVLVIGLIGWRATYGAGGALIALVIAPMVWWLLREQTIQKSRSQPQEIASTARSWTRIEVLTDWRFYLLLPAISAPSIIVTAIFFHASVIANAKGWGMDWMTGSYWLYAVGSVVASLAAGPLIDRISAARILPSFLMPMAAGMVIIWAFDHFMWAWPYLMLVGVTVGISFTALNSLWAEVYGLQHFGAIRSLAVSIAVFSSALGPPGMGALMDLGVSVENVCAFMALYCLGATALLMVSVKGYDRSSYPTAKE
jgi:MFS family permease